MTASESWIESTIRQPDLQPEHWVTANYAVRGRSFRFARPVDPDRLLDDPAVQSASRASDYMPYWAFLWPGACLLADHVLAQTWPAGSRVIELGCGLGLAGLAALAAELHVTFTDYSPAALSVAKHNAQLNGFTNFDTRIVDWRQPPRESFELVLGADVLYEPRCLPDILHVLNSVLAPDGEACLSDPMRGVADRFPELSRAQGFRVRTESAEAIGADGRTVSGRIFRVDREPGRTSENAGEAQP